MKCPSVELVQSNAAKDVVSDVPAASTRSQQQDHVRAILADDIEWKRFPAFPPSVALAVLVGHPSEPGPYTIRVRVPHDVKLMPHRHPEDRVYTVISGVFFIGIGEQFTPDALRAYPPGAVVVLPGNTPHFHWARSGEYVTQVTAMGPLGLDYVRAADDPARTIHADVFAGTDQAPSTGY